MQNMIDEYAFLKKNGCIHGKLPPVSNCYANIIDEILSKHKWFNTPFFTINSRKRQFLEYYRLDKEYFVDTRPPIYTKKECVQIPLNYNVGLYHQKCRIKDSKFIFNKSLDTITLKPNLSMINTLEHGNSHGHFVTQIIPQIIHSQRHFEEYKPTIACKNHRWYAEILDFFEIDSASLNFLEIPKNFHVKANNTLHIEIPDHTSGFNFCHQFSRQKPKSHNTIYKRIFLSRDRNFSRIENYEEIAVSLKKSGFKFVDPLKLSLESGRNILTNTEIVIVEFGGSFTNLIHLEPGSKVIVLIPEALLDHNLNAKPKHFVYNLLEWLQPLLFFFDVKIVKGSYDSTDLYRWDSGDTLGDSERTKCRYSVEEILNFIS